MDYILEGIQEGLLLIGSLDKELLYIVFVSLMVSASATVISSAVTIPVFIYVGMKKRRGEKILARICNTMMSMPSILIGLIVALILARRGPLGAWRLMYTKTAMIIAQILLVTPLIGALTYERTRIRGRAYEALGRTLGANRIQTARLVGAQLRNDIFMIAVTAFSRAISEVGAVMMVGGNIKGKTRVMTTAIALSNAKGEYSLAIALGIVLLVTSMVVNFAAHFVLKSE